MKQYPYIGKFHSAVKLFFAPNQFLEIESGHGSSRHEINYENNTHEFLSNTWGVVKSKEHAEFIIELAMSNDLVFYDDKDEIECNYFTFNEGSKLFFYEHEDELNKVRCKQITIPLPPKAKGAKDKFLNKAIEGTKSKLIYVVKAELKEWPQVGDKVVSIHSGNSVTVLAKDKNRVCANWKGNLILLDNKDIKKPKSKQDLLIEELQTKLCERNHVDNYMLACDIVQGMIEGLSYESK